MRKSYNTYFLVCCPDVSPVIFERGRSFLPQVRCGTFGENPRVMRNVLPARSGRQKGAPPRNLSNVLEVARGEVRCSDAVEPTVKRSVCAEGVDGAKCFHPGLLCQVFCGFGIFDASQNVRIEAGLVCGDKWGKR